MPDDSAEQCNPEKWSKEGSVVGLVEDLDKCKVMLHILDNQPPVDLLNEFDGGSEEVV